MDSVIRAAIATSIGGIIIAGATYYFFTPRDPDPREGLEIVYRNQKVPTGLFLHVVNKARGQQEQNKGVPIREFAEYFNYSDSVTISTFTIENKTGQTVSDLSGKYTEPFILSFSNDNKGVNAVEGAGGDTFSLEILPGETATVSSIGPGYSYLDPPVNFTLNGKSVDVREVEPWSYYPYGDAARSYPLLASFLLFIGFVTCVVVTMVFIFELLVGRKPSAQATLTSSETLGRSLALLNYVKIENPSKFARAVTFAEKTFSKWSPNQPEDGSTSP